MASPSIPCGMEGQGRELCWGNYQRAKLSLVWASSGPQQQETQTQSECLLAILSRCPSIHSCPPCPFLLLLASAPPRSILQSSKVLWVQGQSSDLGSTRPLPQSSKTHESYSGSWPRMGNWGWGLLPFPSSHLKRQTFQTKPPAIQLCGVTISPYSLLWLYLFSQEMPANA